MNRKLSANERLANVVRGWIKSMVAAYVAGGGAGDGEYWEEPCIIRH